MIFKFLLFLMFIKFIVSYLPIKGKDINLKYRYHKPWQSDSKNEQETSLEKNCYKACVM